MHTMPPDTPRHLRPLGPPGLVERDALVLGRNHAVRRAVRGRYSLHRIADYVGTGGPRAKLAPEPIGSVHCMRPRCHTCVRTRSHAGGGRLSRTAESASGRAQARCHPRPGARPGAVRGPVPCMARCHARPGAVQRVVPGMSLRKLPHTARSLSGTALHRVPRSISPFPGTGERERVSGNE